MTTLQRDSAVVEKLDAIAALVKESLGYIRLLAMPVVRNVVEEELGTEIDKHLYMACMGRSVRDLAAEMQISPTTAHKKLQRWMEKGLLQKDLEGHYQRIFDLRALGLMAGDGISQAAAMPRD